MAFEHYDKCSLLLPMDGANNGTVFTDWSPNPKTVTVSGNAKTATAQSKYYGSSGYFDGSASYLSGNSVDIIGGNFTICGYFRNASVTGSRRIFSTGGGFVGFNGTNGLHSLFQTNSENFQFQFWNGSSVVSLAAIGYVAINTWGHAAATFDGVTVRLFVDGILRDSSTSIPVRPSTTPTWAIGRIPGETDNYYLGNLQDIIVVKEALWVDDFTPPARLIGELSNTSALAPVEDETGTPAERTIIAVPRSYPTRAFGTVSDVNGDFTLRAPATECSVIAIHEGSPVKNDLIHRVTPV